MDGADRWGIGCSDEGQSDTDSFHSGTAVGSEWPRSWTFDLSLTPEVGPATLVKVLSHRADG